MSFPTSPIGNYPPPLPYQPYQKRPIDLGGLAQMSAHRENQKRQAELDRQRELSEQEDRADKEEQQLLSVIGSNPDANFESILAAFPNVRSNRIGLYREVSKAAKRRKKQQEASSEESSARGQLGDIAAMNPNDPRVATPEGVSEFLRRTTPTLSPQFESEQLAAGLREIERAVTDARLKQEASEIQRRRDLSQRRAEKTIDAQVEVEKQAALTLQERELAKSDPEILGILNDGAPDLATAIEVKEGKRYQEGVLGGHIRGSRESVIAQGSRMRAGIHELLVKMELASKEFAATGKGSAFTGTVEEFKKKFGDDADPFFAELDVIRSQAQALIARARSGAVLNEREIKIVEKAFTSDAELKIVNGKLSKSARSRMDALMSVLESETVGLYPPNERKRRRFEFRTMTDSLRSEFSRDRAGFSDLPFAGPAVEGYTPGARSFNRLYQRLNPQNAP